MEAYFNFSHIISFFTIIRELLVYFADANSKEIFIGGLIIAIVFLAAGIAMWFSAKLIFKDSDKQTQDTGTLTLKSIDKRLQKIEKLLGIDDE